MRLPRCGGARLIGGTGRRFHARSELSAENLGRHQEEREMCEARFCSISLRLIGELGKILFRLPDGGRSLAMVWPAGRAFNTNGSAILGDSFHFVCVKAVCVFQRSGPVSVCVRACV